MKRLFAASLWKMVMTHRFANELNATWNGRNGMARCYCIIFVFHRESFVRNHTQTHEQLVTDRPQIPHGCVPTKRNRKWEPQTHTHKEHTETLYSSTSMTWQECISHKHFLFWLATISRPSHPVRPAWHCTTADRHGATTANVQQQNRKINEWMTYFVWVGCVP